ncbi:hypothetical protein SAMN04489730_5954 [Amycolatopsis australiensis]|uniref:Uncharacterized protein n=1 Tax=Amycolatopsis australiensis TaxID=546364 RepID=A0A1K1SL15_9PSEU|nr:hypothetical protein SAMN04489730_5954 [Amycolatopsis australiensis]
MIRATAVRCSSVSSGVLPATMPSTTATVSAPATGHAEFCAYATATPSAVIAKPEVLADASAMAPSVARFGAPR